MYSNLFQQILDFCLFNLVAILPYFKSPSSPSFSYFPPSTSLKCCSVLLTSFGGKKHHLKGWLVALPSSDDLLTDVSSGVFLSRVSQGIFAQPSVSSHYYPYYQLTVVTHVKLGASGHWLGTRPGAVVTATLA